MFMWNLFVAWFFVIYITYDMTIANKEYILSALSRYLTLTGDVWHVFINILERKIMMQKGEEDSTKYVYTFQVLYLP